MNVSNGMAALGLLGFLVWIFAVALGLVVTVLWILMPFAVFAIRRRLDAHAVEQQALLTRIERHLAELAERGRTPPNAG